MTFGDKWRKHRESYWDAMAERCKDLPFDALLAEAILKQDFAIEIGCGAGHFAESLFASGFRGSYWGCDISPAAVRAAQARIGHRGIVEIGQFELLSAARKVPSAEIVFARSVIQHQRHWLPLVQSAMQHAPLVVLGISRAIYFKEFGEHEVTDRGTWFDVRISLEAMQREASAAGLSCGFVRTEGHRGPEVVISLSRR